MGEGAGGDEIDAGEGDVANGGEGDAAAGLEFDRGGAAKADGFAQLSGGHVIEEDDVDAGDGEEGADLVEAYRLRPRRLIPG